MARIVTGQHDGVRWSAWRQARPRVRGYGGTEQEAIDHLVRSVEPLMFWCCVLGVPADDGGDRQGGSGSVMMDVEKPVRPTRFLGPILFCENRPGLIAAAWRFLGRFFGSRWTMRGVEDVSFVEKAQRIVE